MIQVRFPRREVVVSRICFRIGGLVIGGKIIGNRHVIVDTHAEAFVKIVAYVVDEFDGICLLSFGDSFRALSLPPHLSLIVVSPESGLTFYGRGGEPLRPALQTLGLE